LFNAAAGPAHRQWRKREGGGAVRAFPLDPLVSLPFHQQQRQEDLPPVGDRAMDAADLNISIAVSPL